MELHLVKDLGTVQIGDAVRTAGLVKSGNGLTVPEAAVQAIGERHYVSLWIKGSDGSFAVRRVRLGPISNGYYPILDGLTYNDEVVKDGQLPP